jgi:hypothetical protein
MRRVRRIEAIMTGAPVDPLEAAIAAGTVAALRRCATAIRQRAAPVVVLDGYRPVVRIFESKAAHLHRIARDFDEIADAIEAEGASS